MGSRARGREASRGSAGRAARADLAARAVGTHQAVGRGDRFGARARSSACGPGRTRVRAGAGPPPARARARCPARAAPLGASGHVGRHHVRDRQRGAELQRGHEVPRDALVGERRPRASKRGVRRGTAATPMAWQPAPRAPTAQPRQRERAVRAQPLARTRHRPPARRTARRRDRRHESPIQSTHESLPGGATEQHVIVTIVRRVRANSVRRGGPGRCGLDLRPDRPDRAGRVRRHLRAALARLTAGRRSAGGALQQARAVDHRDRAAVRRADLADRRPRRAVRLLPHGPAPDSRRPGADLPDARADQAHPAPGHAPHPAVERERARSGTLRSA